MLALLGPWPEISLAGEALKDLGLPDVFRVVRKDDGKRTIYHPSALERSLAPWEGGTALSGHGDTAGLAFLVAVAWSNSTPREKCSGIFTWCFGGCSISQYRCHI